MPKPTTNFNDSNGSDLGSVLITKEYLSSVYPNIDGGQMQIFGWGLNSNGQLGVNDFISRSTPVQEFTSSTIWKQVSTGLAFAAAIKTDGTLWTWGRNQFGQLGVNDTTNRITPVQEFSSSTNWKYVNCGTQHMGAIKTDGTLWMWGSNTYANLGVNDNINRSTPVQEFTSSTNWKQLACTGSNTISTIAIKEDGTLWYWGWTGLAPTSGGKSTPTQILTDTDWKQISAAGYTFGALKTDGTLWVWGYDNNGQLGINGNGTLKRTPVQEFTSSTNWKQVSAGERNGQNSSYAAIKTDGTLWVWGSNTYANLGVNDNINRSTPVQEFTSSTNWKYVSAGAHMAAIKTDGTLWGWGINSSYGQLGVNDNINRSTPVQEFTSSTNWIQVSTQITFNNTMALKAPLLGPQ